MWQVVCVKGMPMLVRFVEFASRNRLTDGLRYPTGARVANVRLEIQMTRTWDVTSNGSRGNNNGNLRRRNAIDNNHRRFHIYFDFLHELHIRIGGICDVGLYGSCQVGRHID
jgi:hypothetical protein